MKGALGKAIARRRAQRAADELELRPGDAHELAKLAEELDAADELDAETGDDIFDDELAADLAAEESQPAP